MATVAARAGYPKARRIGFRFGDAASGKYFVDDDIVFSHLVAGLSGAFPPGEESFIRSVRRFAGRVTDPGLRRRVAGFIGQESTHGQQHRLLNAKLIALGYPIAWYDREAFIDRVVRLENRLPAHLHLAMTAAAEHVTAVIAARVLSDDDIQAIPGDLQVWNLLNWHALEELEHKSVAFDVFRAVGGTERTRISTMAVMMLLGIPFTMSRLWVSVALDPFARRRPARVLAEAYRLYTGPLFAGLLPELARYLRPGFHPDDIDTSALLQRWQTELFGADGTLTGYLK